MDENKLNDFQRRTGERDENISVQILQKNGWDVEKSIREYRNKGVYTTIYNIIKFPFIPILSITAGIFSIGKYFFWTLMSFGNNTNQRKVAEHTTFIQNFEDTYGEIHPAFFPGTFQQAAQKAKSEFQFLVAYLHSPTHPKSEDFCRKTLCTQVVSDYVNTNFVFWGGDISQKDAFNTSNTLGATSYPFIAIIHCSSDNKLQVLDRFISDVPLDEFLERLGNNHELHSGLLQLDKGRAEQDVEDHEVISRQDEAYQQSLQKDMERIRKEELRQIKLHEEKELEERKKRELERELREEKEREERIEREKQNKLEQRKLLIEQKRMELANEPPEGQDVCQIMFLLQGKKVKRGFLFSDKLSQVFDFVDVSLGDGEYKDFCLVTSFPRKVFERSDMCLKDCGFTSKMSLIYEEI